MIIYKNSILIALLHLAALTSGTNGNGEPNSNQNQEPTLLEQELEETLPNTVPDHEYNENFEHDVDELSLEIRKQAIKKGIIDKHSTPPSKPVLYENVKGMTTPQGIAINGKEWISAATINAIALTQPNTPSNFYAYKPIPHHQGVWELIDINKINFKEKRVALIVHGHHLTSLLDSLSTYCHTKISNLLFWVKPKEISNAAKPNFYYGLDTLVNLGRMLYQDIYDKQGKPRYDYVIGYAYSSWGELKTLSHNFTQDINSSGLQNARAVELFAHSMGGVMTRWSLEQEGLGQWIHNCVFIASPHQGVPFCLNFFGDPKPNRKELIAFTPPPLISTTDLITRNLDLDDYASDFIKELTFTPSPHASTANYHTLAGYQYNTLTWSALKEGEMPKSYDLCPGSVNQKYLDRRFGVGKILSDGLVAIYSATSEYLKNKSHQYGRTEDYQHSVILPLDHRTLTGDDLQPTLFQAEQNDTPYKMVLNTLKNWIQYWPD